MTNLVQPKQLVCIFAHPDDEAFGPGGSILHFAQTCDVHIVCVTDGGAGRSSDPKLATNLASVRKHEMQESCKVLGVKNLTFLDFADGDLSNNNYHMVADRIKTELDKLTPDTLLTFNLDGCSGHLDHIAVAMITSYLFEKLSYVKQLLYFCEKREIKVALKDTYFVYFPPGYKSDEVDLVLDVSPYHETQLQAMHKHVSQSKDCDWILSEFGDHLNTEYFRILQK